MRRKTFGVFDAINLLIMLLLLFGTIYPLYYMAINSISAGDAVISGKVNWLPIGIHFQAYRIVLSDPMILHAYGNTVFYTAAGVAVDLIMTTLCAYPLARRYFYGRHLFSLFVVFTMFFTSGLIPLYMVVYSLGMVNTIWALFIPTAINAFYMILMRTFFENIPEEMFESATVDGAGEWTMLTRLALPLSKPVMATMFLFYAVYHWNSFFPALIYLNDKKLFPLQITLRNIVVQGNLQEQMQFSTVDITQLLMSQNLKYAVVFVAIIPVLAVYPFVQKYFVQGSMLGSLKG